MASRTQDPSLYRRRLRSELRRAREAVHMTQKDVAAAMDWSLSKLIRIETGNVTITTNDLRALLAHYGITDPARVADLVDQAKKSRERSPWWTRHRDVISQEMLQFLGYESSAKVIRNFEPLLMPGLLQTEEYARDLFKYLRGAKDLARIDSLVRLRLERQEILQGDNPPSVHFLIDEGVIRRVVGGPAVMRRQLEHLKKMAALDNVTISVVPFGTGMYRGLRVPYVLFEFDDLQDDNILYLENPSGESIIIEAGDDEEGDPGIPTPGIHLEMFWEVEQRVSDYDSLALIDDALAAIGSDPAPGAEAPPNGDTPG